MYTAIIRTNHLELTALHFSETIHTSSAKKRYIMLLSCNMKASAEVAVFIITLNLWQKCKLLSSLSVLVYTWLIHIETQRFMHTWLRRRGMSTSLVKLISIVVKTAFILFILNALYSSYQSCHALSKFKYLTKLNSNWVIWLFWISHRKVNLFFLQILTVGTTKNAIRLNI